MEEFGDAAAAGHIDLDAVDRFGVDEVQEVGKAVAVLPRGDVAAERVADLPQSGMVIGADGLLEPGDAEAFEGAAQADGLRHGVSAVGVDEHLDVGTDQLTGLLYPVQVAGLTATPVLADLDLDSGHAEIEPAVDLFAELSVVVAGEAAGAVERHGVTPGAEQPVKGFLGSTRRQIPQGAVDGRNRHRTYARPADVA